MANEISDRESNRNFEQLASRFIEIDAMPWREAFRYSSESAL